VLPSGEISFRVELEERWEAKALRRPSDLTVLSDSNVLSAVC
jgi:hypothetical protein